MVRKIIVAALLALLAATGAVIAIAGPAAAAYLNEM